jgi:hypothetical protein
MSPPVQLPGYLTAISQPPTSPVITGPNNSQLVPLKPLQPHLFDLTRLSKCPLPLSKPAGLSTAPTKF